MNKLEFSIYQQLTDAKQFINGILRLSLAEAPDISQELLEQYLTWLLRHNNNMGAIRQAHALEFTLKHKLITSQLITKMFKRTQNKCFVHHRLASYELFKLIFEGKFTSSILTALASVHCPPQYLAEYTKIKYSWDPTYANCQRVAIKNPQCSQTDLLAVFDEEVTQHTTLHSIFGAAIANPKCPPAILHDLYLNPQARYPNLNPALNAELKIMVLENPNCPATIINQFKFVQKEIDFNSKQTDLERQRTPWRLVAKHPALTHDKIRHLWSLDSVRPELVLNPNCPTDLLFTAMLDLSVHITHVLEHPNASLKVLLLGITDRDKLGAAAAVLHPNARPWILQFAQNLHASS